MVPHPITYLIDDNEIDCYVAKKYLSLNYPENQVITFHSTAEALKMLENLDYESYPAQILLDIAMPAINGWDFLEAYTALPNYPFNNRKVIIITCSIHPIDKQKAKQYACITDFICKPLLQS